MYLIIGLLLNIAGSVLLGLLVGEHSWNYMIPMIMFNFAGMMIVKEWEG